MPILSKEEHKRLNALHSLCIFAAVAKMFEDSLLYQGFSRCETEPVANLLFSENCRELIDHIQNCMEESHLEENENSLVLNESKLQNQVELDLVVLQRATEVLYQKLAAWGMTNFTGRTSFRFQHVLPSIAESISKPNEITRTGVRVLEMALIFQDFCIVSFNEYLIKNADALQSNIVAHHLQMQLSPSEQEIATQQETWDPNTFFGERYGYLKDQGHLIFAYEQIEAQRARGENGVFSQEINECKRRILENACSSRFSEFENTYQEAVESFWGVCNPFRQHGGPQFNPSATERERLLQESYYAADFFGSQLLWLREVGYRINCLPYSAKHSRYIKGGLLQVCKSNHYANTSDTELQQNFGNEHWPMGLYGAQLNHCGESELLAIYQYGSLTCQNLSDAFGVTDGQFNFARRVPAQVSQEQTIANPPANQTPVPVNYRNQNPLVRLVNRQRARVQWVQIQQARTQRAQTQQTPAQQTRTHQTEPLHHRNHGHQCNIF